jgi:CubicO group peptidase (beta-lactamase class C family)
VQQALNGFSAFEQVRENAGLASLTVAVVAGQDLLWSQGFGCADLTAQTPATPTTVYGIASMTKMFTATMLMQLVDAGKVALNDPVNTYVSGATYQSPSGGAVSPTFLQLASHTSGLPDTVTTATTMQEFLPQLQSTTAQSEPGTTYLYSNLGYVLLGQVLAQVAGQSYEQYVTDQILTPLGMTHSGFGTPSVPQDGYATPYTSATPTAQPITYLPWGLNDPSGGMFSTAVDMAQFLKLQFSDGSVNGHRILSPAAMQQMLQQVMAAGPEPLTGIAIGWQYYVPQKGYDFYGKDGLIAGFNGDLLLATGHNIGVYIICNTVSSTNPGSTPITLLGAAEVAMTEIIPTVEAAGQ